MRPYQNNSKPLSPYVPASLTTRAFPPALPPAAPYFTFGVKWLDYDNAGWLDLLFVNGHVQDNVADVNAIWGRPTGDVYRQPVQLFHNHAGKRFEEMSDRLGGAQQPIVGRGLAIGDYDNDGRIDALVVDSEGAPLLLHNETPDAGHWLLLKLEGKRCNRDGLGALVTVEAGG